MSMVFLRLAIDFPSKICYKYHIVLVIYIAAHDPRVESGFFNPMGTEGEKL